MSLTKIGGIPLDLHDHSTEKTSIANSGSVDHWYMCLKIFFVWYGMQKHNRPTHLDGSAHIDAFFVHIKNAGDVLEWVSSGSAFKNYRFLRAKKVSTHQLQGSGSVAARRGRDQKRQAKNSGSF